MEEVSEAVWSPCPVTVNTKAEDSSQACYSLNKTVNITMKGTNSPTFRWRKSKKTYTLVLCNFS